MTKRPLVSVVIPTSNRAASLARTLESLSRMEEPSAGFEVIVVDDGSTDNTPAEVGKAKSLFAGDRLRYERVPKKNICHAKNRGLECALGDIVAFTDDDCTFERDWLVSLIRPFEDPSVGAVGGPDRAPADSTPLAGAVDYAFTGLMGSGGVRRGGGARRVAQFYPRGCNMAVRKSCLARTGVFDERLYNGEEIDLDYRIVEAGFTLVYQPSCPVWHHRRSSFAGLARQVFHRGITRRMLFLKNPRFFEFGYIAPAGIVLYFALLSLASVFHAAARWPLMLSACVYAVLVLAGGAHCFAMRRRAAEAALVPLVLPLQHFAYGLGLLVAPLTGAFRSLRKDLRTAHSQTANAPLRILISNDGFGPNQGDRAILEVMTADLRSTFADVEIRGFLNSWVPSPNSLLRFWRDMMWADVFLLGGGQVLHDHTCLLFLLAALAKLALARMAGTPAVCYAIGAGPIASRLGRRLTRTTLNRVGLILARDEATAALLVEIGVRPELIHVTACPAFRLAAHSSERIETMVRDAREDGGPLVVICPRRWFQYQHGLFPLRWKMWYRREAPGSERFSMLLDAFAELIRRLVRERKAGVLLLPMKQSVADGDPGQDDDAVCRELSRRVGDSKSVRLVGGDLSPGEVKALLGRADAVVTMRMHAAIMALPQNVPCVALALSSKFMDLYRRLGLDDLAVPVDQVSPELLHSAVDRALSSGPRMESLLHEPLAAAMTRSKENARLLQAWVTEHLKPETARGTR